MPCNENPLTDNGVLPPFNDRERTLLTKIKILQSSLDDALTPAEDQEPLPHYDEPRGRRNMALDSGKREMIRSGC